MHISISLHHFHFYLTHVVVINEDILVLTNEIFETRKLSCHITAFVC